MLDGSAKALGWLALRVLLAVALVLAGHFSNAAITALKPALAWGLTKAAPDCQFWSFQLGQDRNQTVLGAVVRQQRTLVLGGAVRWCQRQTRLGSRAPRRARCCSP